MPAVNVKDLAPLLRKLGHDAKAAILRGTLSGALRAVTEMQRRGDAAGAFDRGGYRRGWKARPTERGAVLFNDTPQAPIIESGRRPGARRPPIPVIERWAKRKLALSAKDAKAAAFPIAQAIATRGVPGKHVLKQAVPALLAIVTAEVRREVEQAVKMAAAKRR